MKRIFAAAILLLALAGASRAQTVILKEGDILRGRFAQERHMSGFAKPIRSEGSFVLAPGLGLIWTSEVPFPVTTVITPAGLVQNVGGSETMRLSAARLPFLSRLYHMLGGAMAGETSALEAGFTVRREPVDGGSERITMTPRQSDDPMAQQIKAIVISVSRFVDEVEIRRSNEDFDHLTFSGQALSAGPLEPAEAAALQTGTR
jgi:hypothetical protein